MKLTDPIETVPHTAPRTFSALKRLGIHTIYDLLLHVPHRYKAYETVLTPAQVPPFQMKEHFEQPTFTATVKGTVHSITQIRTRSRITIQKATITDGEKHIEAVWFNQPYILTTIRKGKGISIAGVISHSKGVWSMQVDEYELEPEARIHTSGKIPVYPETHGVSSRTIREKIALIQGVTVEVTDPLPEVIRQDHSLLSLEIAVKQLHSPTSDVEIEGARKRLAFDELFMMQLSSQVTKQEWSKEHVAKKLDTDSYKKDIKALIASLPFTLTAAQLRVHEELLGDLSQEKPMNRLLQGDVGSGKTVIAALAAFVVHKNNLRTLLLAPTALLAQQHYETFLKVFDTIPIKKRPTIALITGSTKLKKESEQADIIIGTHALFTKNREYQDVGLVVIDEQHKFGVKQRATLKEKGMNTHLLTMTATPIPRTVYLVRFGELDISIIDELPVGRQPQQTFVVPKAKQQKMHEWIQDYLIKNKAQMFVVCPFIDESEVETLKNVKAAQVEFQRLTSLYPKLRLALLHGKMPAKEKQEVMDAFRRHDYDILVTTPIIEVGVDIPRAQIIVIETAERFGLAQLHQLRGRVGRGGTESFCYLCVSSATENKRLEEFAKTSSGFVVAELDLKYRGAGDMYGVKQHGISDLKIASFTNTELVEGTRKAVEQVMKEDLITPELTDFINKMKDAQISRD